MPGPLPKSEPVRRNARPNDEWVDLPAEGRTDPVPEVPFTVELGTDGLAWWAHQWRSPSATQWLESDWHATVRRAQLEDLWQSTKAKPAASILTEIRFLDGVLGLTAKSRRELRWRITDDTDDDDPGTLAPVRRLKVVDSQAS